MGTPVKIRAREEQCVGAGPCGDPRPLTKEEMLKYYTKEEIEGMSKKIGPPEREKLLIILSELLGKTKAIYHAAKVFNVSAPVIYGWIKDYGIQFDADGRVIRDNAKVVESEEKPIQMPSSESEEEKEEFHVVGSDIKIDIVADDEADTIHITGQETKEIPKRLGYAEHDIGNATLQIDFRKELVKIITPDNDEMTFEEAIAAAELILDILGHE
jgi:hypothetical protein